MITESTKPTFSIVIPVFNTEKYLKVMRGKHS